MSCNHPMEKKSIQSIKTLRCKLKITTLSRRSEELEMRKKVTNEVLKIAQNCVIYDLREYFTNECPIIPIIKEIFNKQATVIGMLVRMNRNIYM